MHFVSRLRQEFPAVHLARQLKSTYPSIYRPSAFARYHWTLLGSCRHASSSTAHTLRGDSSKWTRKTIRWSLVTSGLVGLAFAWDYFYGAHTLERNTRTLWNGLMLVLDYKLNYDPNNLDKMNNVHERAAARLLHVCKKNGGLYVKAGQAIGIQVAILPKPYHVLAQLFDSAEPIPLDAVRNVIYSELGMWPEEIFAEFDSVPIGSASIAQVHRAKLHTGDLVAVKVQRPDIRKHAKWDLLAFRTLMRVYERVFDLPLSFASQYISDQIELETHFDHERENTERIRHHVLYDVPKRLRGGVAYVPAVYGAFSTPRLLVSEYIDGAVRMTDVKGLEERLGLDVNEVMKSVCEVFAAQVFRWGFVNADPHPSNVLIRRHPKRPHTHQVVLIDHGLSIPLPPKFRRQYLNLWKSLFTNDTEGLKEVCNQWGIDLGDDGFGMQAMGSAVLLQGWSKSSGPKRRGAKGVKGAQPVLSKEERQKKELEIQRQMKATVKRFLQNYELIPKELIFLGRSMRIIQANNQLSDAQAVGSPVDRIRILARGASDSLYSITLFPPPELRDTSPQRKSFLATYIDANIEWYRFRAAITGLNVAFGSWGVFWGVLWVYKLWVDVKMVLGLKTTQSQKALVGEADEEDPFQQHMIDMAKEMGVEIDENVFMG
ncbi:ABC1 family protein C10F6.14c [Serendipita indica DSM 11827]|uniref:Related to bacterial aminoglycoside acetyltransferase regulators n=1 Tax=Serendipita indica (strain DSM 11827) TaxID=1109443 RepID=G4TRX7_SERID|nr:ABC1 family protein C10F6.14c [Serendipita indica DSM 11827]CCA74070.1 related to bacterial aminoglycoside acetyltransferase regulators [Serendipita indica DSM 11827]